MNTNWISQKQKLNTIPSLLFNKPLSVEIIVICLLLCNIATFRYMNTMDPGQVVSKYLSFKNILKWNRRNKYTKFKQSTELHVTQTNQ